MKNKDIRLYLVFYKGNGGSLYERLQDKMIRFFTKGPYSHCEIVVVKDNMTPVFYSSSPRDNGVRRKTMDINYDHWDLVEVEGDLDYILDMYERTKHTTYDLRGALGSVLGFKQHPSKYFCSEWCYNALTKSEDGWRFTPNSLYAIAISKKFN